MEEEQINYNIEFSGLDALKVPERRSVKHIAASHAEKMEGRLDNFEKLRITIKPVHKTEKNSKYEVHAKLTANKAYTAEGCDYDVLALLDNVLTKVQHEVRIM